MILVQKLILFFKCFIIGIGKVIPGVSGSLLAISMGLYEEILQRVEHLFKNFKENVRFLFPIGLGVLLAIILGSKVLLYFFETYYVYTITFFIGLILGTVPEIVKKGAKKAKDWLIISSIFLIMYFIYTKIELTEFIPTSSVTSYLYIILLGFIDALTMVMPGISGTATYMMLGSYTFILNLFARPFAQIGYCLLFGSGLLIGVFLMIKIVNYYFKNHANLTWDIILSFLFSSVFFLILKIIDLINKTNIFSLFLLFVIGFFLISVTNKEE